MRSFSVLVLIGLAACAKGPAPASNAAVAAAPANAAAAAAQAGKLAKIFTPDVLGSNVAFLETVTGPAFRTDGSDRTYKVDGCTVIVGAKGGKIDNIGIEGYGGACSFPIAQYFAGGAAKPTPNLPTFGDIKQGLGGHYNAACFHLCGNAGDPVVSLSYQGSHADNFNDLYAAVSIGKDDAALAAFTDWGDQLTKKYGEDYVVNGGYSGGDSLQDVATKDFAKIAPTTIRVGQNLPGAD